MNHLNEMKNLAGKLSLVFALLCALVVQSCKDDDEDPDPVTVEFSTGDISVQETAAPQTINVSLGEAAFRDGSLSISVSPQNAADVLTVPTTVPITKGNTAVQFNVTPVNNTAVNSISHVTLTLSSVGDGFTLGTKKEIKITILDDEGPAQASFESTTGTVTEADEPVTVSILFSRAAKTAGNLTISYSPADAAIATSPAATAGKITVPVAAGAEEVSFTVEPNEGATAEGPLEIIFTIAASTSDVASVAGSKFVLTVEPVTAGEYTPIADLRAMFAGEPKPLTNPITIHGTVISSNDNVTSKNVWVHDGEAGILLRFINDNTTSENKLNLGDEVSVDLTGSTLQEFNGTLQVGNNDLANAKATILGEHDLPAYKIITIDEFLSGEYEGDLVQIDNVTFPAADGIKDVTGNTTFTDGSKNGTLRVESYAPFKSKKQPQGTGSVKGIASEYTTGASPAYQLTPQVAEDIFDSNLIATITASKTSLAFGDVENGSASDAQNFTVSGNGLTAAVTITAPAQFQVSLTEGSDYAASVSIPAAVANAGGIIVYVKFAPTSGTNQTFNGNIVLASTGAANVEVAVSGSETGNDAPPVQAIQFNEVHYDNVGTDIGEFVELSAAADLDVTGYQIILYNGNGGASYGTKLLSELTPVTVGDRKYYVWDVVLQNGDPDGIALVNGAAAVVEFISYGGVMTATGGSANGVTSVDIGKEFPIPAADANASLQRQENGTWKLSVTGNTKGAPNAVIE